MRRRLTALVGAVIFSAGLATAATAPAMAAQSSPAITQQARPPVFYKWRFANPTVRPRAIYWGAGGSLFVKGLRWAHWNRTSAWGRGTRWANTCDPNCGSGNYIRSPATATFWRWRWHLGHRYWTRLTLRWRHNGPHKHVYTHTAGGDWP